MLLIPYSPFEISYNTDLANKISVLTLDSGYTKIQDIPTGMYSLTASLMLALTDRPSGYVGGRCYLTTQKQVADDWYEVLYNPSAQSMWTRYRYGSVGEWQKVSTNSDLTNYIIIQNVDLSAFVGQTIGANGGALNIALSVPSGYRYLCVVSYYENGNSDFIINQDSGNRLIVRNVATTSRTVDSSWSIRVAYIKA